MPRKNWRLRAMKPKLSPAKLAYLTGDPAASEDDPEYGWTLWCYRNGMPGLDGDDHPRDLWQRHREEFLPAFIAEHPCSRPEPWWRWSAPRWTRKFGWWLDGQLPEPRLRLGGIGTPRFEALSVVPIFDRGIPVGWVRQWDCDFYNGRLPSSEHGWPPRGRQPQEGDFVGIPVDPNDPRRFESEAEYLRRHALLSAAELKHLATHPELLEPVVIRPDDEEEHAEDYVPHLSRSERAAPCR